MLPVWVGGAVSRLVGNNAVTISPAKAMSRRNAPIRPSHDFGPACKPIAKLRQPRAIETKAERVVKVLFDEFEDVTKTKLSDKRKLGRILKVILFGSYARGDWVEDRLSGCRSDYDLLIVVNSHQFTDLHEYWGKADEHFIREVTVTQNIKTPVNFIVHDLADVNDQLAKGRPTAPVQLVI